MGASAVSMVFKSGGLGSGIYMSADGGEKWTKLTPEANQIPSGELGRIGLSFAPSNPNYVYAFIEAEQNAVWRSTDGGYHWQQQSKGNDKKAGDRPFYYADLYVDVQNENRVYSLATQITSTEDGGKTWQVFAAGNKIHTDHHAWWAHPTNPNVIIAGNDGGLMLTNDRGKKWLFVDNLPLGQFYHVRVDEQIPYNVYGGMQDNGSWKGPGYTWFAGDIRNLYWQRIGTSDGFDVIPDPSTQIMVIRRGRRAVSIAIIRRRGKSFQFDLPILKMTFCVSIGIPAWQSTRLIKRPFIMAVNFYSRLPITVAVGQSILTT